MTLDTYMHLFDEVRHGADLAKSDFANLLDIPPKSRLRTGGHQRSTRALVQRTLHDTPQRSHCWRQRTSSERPCYLTKT